MEKEKGLFAAFDVYPSAKGAATHIYHSAAALLAYTNSALLYVLGNEKLPKWQEEENGLRIGRFLSDESNYLARSMAYAAALSAQIEEMPLLELAHFRDIWGGIAVLNTPAKAEKKYKTVFEVNAFTSVELPYRYELTEGIIAKLWEIEQRCLEDCDAIICPSKVIAAAIIARGIAAEKITVISNGADLLDENNVQPRPISEDYIIYFGALQPWQGVDNLLRAFALLEDFEDLRLVIIASNRPNYTKKYRKLAAQLGLESRVIWAHQLGKEELQMWLRHALFSVAPLKDTPRNTAQGCSPLKIFESMAAGKTVVASDLPVVREILGETINGENIAKLVRADRPTDLARAMRFLLDFPEAAKKMGENAKKHIENAYTWDKIEAATLAIYAKISEK
jgi:glycosyltransferase involved in cell wall biosynthesis